MNEGDLFKKAKAGNVDAREEIIKKYSWLVRCVAKRYKRLDNFKDLCHIGDVGLLKAIDKVAIEKIIKHKSYFKNYAAKYIMGEILGDFPSMEEVRITISGDGPAFRDEDGAKVIETIVEDQQKIDSQVIRGYTNELLAKLFPAQREVVELMIGMNDGIPHGELETANILGISREKVRKIHEKALRMLHKLASSTAMEKEKQKVLTGKKCLLIEDNPGAIESIKSMLDKYKIEAVSAPTVIDAKSILDDSSIMENISFIILDLRLPYKKGSDDEGKEGERLLVDITEDENTRRKPIIVLSSLLQVFKNPDYLTQPAIDKLKERLTSYGAIRCIPKGELDYKSLISSIYIVLMIGGKVGSTLPGKPITEITTTKGKIIIDITNNRVKFNDELIKLDPIQYEFLLKFIEYGSGNIVPHAVLDDIMVRQGRTSGNLDDKRKAQITNLRNRIKPAGIGLKSKRGTGYWIEY